MNHQATVGRVDDPPLPLPKLTADPSGFSPEISAEQTLRKLLIQDHRFAIQTVSGLMLVSYNDVILFQHIREQRCWQMMFTSRKIYRLRMSVTSKELLAIHVSFVQISNDCIVNLHYLSAIEYRTLKCTFCLPYSDIERVASQLYFRKIRERLEVI